MSRLAVSWQSEGRLRGDNVILPWETTTIRFTDPPDSAADVEIRIVERIVYTYDGKTTGYRLLGGFVGDIEERRFVVKKSFDGVWDDARDPVTIQFQVAGATRPAVAFRTDPDTARIEKHALLLVVTGNIAGRKERFQGRSELRVMQPLAMVVPRGVALRDMALRYGPRFAKRWAAFQPETRRVVETTMVRTATMGKLRHDHFDDFIEAVSLAARDADVVAIATGHGNPGDRTVGFDPDRDPNEVSTAFVNFVPEDKQGIPWRLHMVQDELAPYDLMPEQAAKSPIIFTPKPDEAIKLHALDRLADALKDVRARRLLLHSCRVGQSREFIQMLANRLRFPVMAQKDYIKYEATATPPCFYEKDGDPVLPRDERYWPMHRCGAVIYPRKEAPKRYGP